MLLLAVSVMVGWIVILTAGILGFSIKQVKATGGLNAGNFRLIESYLSAAYRRIQTNQCDYIYYAPVLTNCK